MRGTRIFWFIIMIGLGVMLGLLYGWVISPSRNAEISPESLRADYRADYVLMVAEIYHADQDVAQAARRLAFLGSQPPAEIATAGVLTARDLGYAVADLDMMDQLAQALMTSAATSSPASGGQP